MDYVGAADYYFWDGVSKGLRALQFDLPSYWAPQFVIDNDVTRASLEAFEWGFCLGRILTEEEYTELTTYPKEDIIENIIVTKEDDEKEYIESGVKTKLTGNC